MGQKVHPYGLRLGIFPPNKWEDGTPTKSWKSRWFARKDYVNLLHEDLRIRAYVKKNLKQAGVSSVEIARSSGRIRIKIFTARPGILIGRRGSEIDKLRDEIRKITKSEVFIDPKEVPIPQIDAQLAAENVAGQLERRIHFRRAMKKTISSAMDKGAEGIKIQCRGRLGGAEIARREQYKEGKIPLGTFRANIDYGFTEAHTTYGSIGIKVWICKGEILLKKEEQERQAQIARERAQAEEVARRESAEGHEQESQKEERSSAELSGAQSGRRENKEVTDTATDTQTAVEQKTKDAAGESHHASDA